MKLIVIKKEDMTLVLAVRGSVVAESMMALVLADMVLLNLCLQK